MRQKPMFQYIWNIVSQTIKNDAFKHIIDFQNKSDKNIVGIVFYAGDTILSFGDDVRQRYALPLNLFF